MYYFNVILLLVYSVIFHDFILPYLPSHYKEGISRYPAYSTPHCLKRVIGKGGFHFETETVENRQFPGFSACLAGENDNGCLILTRPSCNFH